MKNINEKLLDAGDASGDLTSNPLQLDSLFGCALQAVITGSPVGTLKLQASCDNGQDAKGTGVVNWTDISGASASISGAGTAMFNVTDTLYRWIRAVYTHTSGTGTITITANAKGV